MFNTYLLHWSLWAISLLAGIGAVLAAFKLRYAERFLPHWHELKELEAILPVRREELRQVSEAIEKYRAEIGQLEATVGHLRILKEWQDANPEAPARIQQMMTDLERCKSELAAVQTKLAQDEKYLKEVTNETNRLNLEKTQLTQEMGTMREQLAGLQKQKSELETALRELQNQCIQKNLELSHAQKKFQELQSELITLRQKVEQAEKEKTQAVRERKEAEAARDVAKVELLGIQKSIDTLKELAKGMQVNLERAGVTGQGNYADLFVPISFPPLAPTNGAPSEQQMLQRARDYIRGKGLVFPERVLHAFHTSLKASDISPLVVLAGISGTGKSELPRHYADGMGIHFLLTSVQPRWDSPQDLFGFYNYLEKRYKATELARALVQFERYNQSDFEGAFDGADIDDRHDRLLLVLLDEMNLARTEYYFSEFLSKLETRRMVNENKAEDRARAEIALDMGGSLDGKTNLRLYPGRNVLFVGTMNEDESTQSLSDKVIDRATVLRFWRPKKTNPETNQIAQALPTNGLTFSSWINWIRPSTDLGAFAGEVDGWIEQLNDALDRLGRPFAFRVDRAIRSYVANYPRWVSNWHKRAMADQIQQRIFPKLRGIEPDQGDSPQAIRVIGGIIDELEDEPLKKAFEASHVNQPTFLFRGVVHDDND